MRYETDNAICVLKDAMLAEYVWTGQLYVLGHVAFRCPKASYTCASHSRLAYARGFTRMLSGFKVLIQLIINLYSKFFDDLTVSETLHGYF